MNSRFVVLPQNTFLQDTNYFHHDGKDWLCFTQLGAEAKQFVASLGKELPDLISRRRVLANKLVERQKKNSLHLVPTIYDLPRIARVKAASLAILQSDKAEMERLVNANEYSDAFPNYVAGGKTSAITVAKKPADLVNQQLLLFYNALLEPFLEMPVELYYLLMAQEDALGRTPLHEACAQLSSHECFKPLLTSITAAALTPEQKRDIALIQDKNGRLFLHDLIYRFNKDALALVTSTFNADVFKKMLEHKNHAGETPLHELCLSTLDRAAKATMIRELRTSEEKVISPAEDMFPQRRKDEANPLHLACQVPAKEAKENAAFMIEMKTILGDSFAKKIEEKDILGNTPLHYAIARSANTELVETILDGLTPAQQKDLILTENKKHQTVLELACQYGDLCLLDRLIRIIGSAAFFAERKRRENFKDAVAASHYLSTAEFARLIETYNSVFELVDYHIKNKSKNNEEIHLKRLDTLARFQALKAKTPQPPVNDAFRGVLTQTYFDFCKKFIDRVEEEKSLLAMQQEYTECRAFFDKLKFDVNMQSLLGVKPKDFPLFDSLFPLGSVMAVPLGTTTHHARLFTPSATGVPAVVTAHPVSVAAAKLIR